MDECMDGQMDERVDGHVQECVNRRMDENGWMGILTDSVWMGVWMEGRVCGLDECVCGGMSTNGQVYG